MTQTFKTNHNIVYSCQYHVVWCPKYRRKVLIDGVDVRLKEILHEEVVGETTGEILELTLPVINERGFYKLGSSDKSSPGLWTNGTGSVE